MAKRMMMTARLNTAPRFFFSRIQESFQKPTGGPAIRSPAPPPMSAGKKRFGDSLRCPVSMGHMLPDTVAFFRQRPSRAGTTKPSAPTVRKRGETNDGVTGYPGRRSLARRFEVYVE